MARGRSPLTMEGCGNSYPITRLLNRLSNKQAIPQSTRAGVLATSTMLPSWRPTRVGPGQYSQYTRAPLKWEEVVGSSQAPQSNKNNAHISNAQLPHGSGACATIHTTIFQDSSRLKRSVCELTSDRDPANAELSAMVSTSTSSRTCALPRP